MLNSPDTEGHGGYFGNNFPIFSIKQYNKIPLQGRFLIRGLLEVENKAR